MSKTNNFQKWWRGLFWLALLILALNIENLAVALGLDKLLSTRWRIVTAIGTYIRSEEALHFALFVAGGGAFAWGSYIFRKMDAGIPNLRYMALDCTQLAEFYSGEKGLLGTESYVERAMVRMTEKLNRKLAIHKISPVPLPEMTSEPSKLHVAQYLGGLAVFLRRKDLNGARNAEQIYLRDLEAVGFVQRPLPEIDGETPPQP